MCINRVHHGYGEHRGILVTVVMVTVTVSNFSTLRVPSPVVYGYITVCSTMLLDVGKDLTWKNGLAGVELAMHSSRLE